MVKYWDRLGPELDAQGIEIADFARSMGISFQAVAKVRDGGAFGSPNNFKAAKLLGLAPEWLASGKGAKYTGPTEPPRAGVSAPPTPLVPQTLGIRMLAKQLAQRLEVLDDAGREVASVALKNIALRPESADKMIDQLASLLGEIDAPQDETRAVSR